MLAHHIDITVFSKPEDNKEQILEGLKKLIQFDIKIEQRNAEGFNEREIKIYSVRIKKQRNINTFLEHFTAKLTEEQKELLQNPKRIDNRYYFYIRLDKEKLLDDEIWITDSGECYHIKIRLAPFPKNRKRAEHIIKKIFQ